MLILKVIKREKWSHKLSGKIIKGRNVAIDFDFIPLSAAGRIFSEVSWPRGKEEKQLLSEN